MALLEKRQYFPGVADILLAQNDSRIIGVFVNDHEKYEGHTLFTSASTCSGTLFTIAVAYATASPRSWNSGISAASRTVFAVCNLQSILWR